MKKIESEPELRWIVIDKLEKLSPAGQVSKTYQPRYSSLKNIEIGLTF